MFNFLAAYTGSADFNLFLSIAFSLGGIGLLWRMIWGAGLRDILQQIVLMLIVGLAGVGTVVNPLAWSGFGKTILFIDGDDLRGLTPSM